MTDIIAAVVDAPGAPFDVRAITLGDPGPGEVRVRIAGVGICHTDLVAQAGWFTAPMPAVFGHEGSGIVESVGQGVTKVAPGDRVALSFLSCGSCACCSRGEPAYCADMTPLNSSGSRPDGTTPLKDGDRDVAGAFFGQSSFASHSIASERNVVKVPEGVPLDIAGILGCGVQTGAGAVLRSLDCAPGSSLVVFGIGAVGLAAVMGAKLRGLSTVIAVEIHESRRALALELGATHAIDPTAEDAAEAIRAILPGGVDAVLDTTGLPQVVDTVPAILAKRGQFGFVGIPPAAQIDLKLPGTLMGAMRNGWTFRGIIEGDSDVDGFLAELMDEYLAGRFPFDRMVARYPLSKINEAVADQHAGRYLKPVLIPGE
ncbi:NAD(P)-dependent alcohol dehydrogenase [Rhodovulum sp. DZ06]|uniref:NAD(P)-dependent alcohol dehydrogenase n=1 Tax=Rhodovulum sp. DZ06 TaxID=3425126 RepID=UPI003D34A3C8